MKLKYKTFLSGDYDLSSTYRLVADFSNYINGLKHCEFETITETRENITVWYWEKEE